MNKKLISLLLAVVMMVSLFSTTASAASSKKSSGKLPQFKTITSLGDSASSGFGLDDYNKQGKFVVYCTRIRGSYPDLVAKELRATKLNQYAISGSRTTELLYLLDNDFEPDYIMKEADELISEGQITLKKLKSLRPVYQKAVKESDMILLDVGFDDIWVPTIACIYDIAEDGRKYTDPDPELTLRQKVAKYGSYEVVFQTAINYLAGFIGNPQKWAEYWIQWDETVLKWATDFFINYNAIIDRIYELNPDVTVVSLGFYNPAESWSILPGDRSLEHSLQLYYDVINSTKQKFEGVLPNYYYVEERNVEMINNRATLPLYENLTLDDSGFNPHPTYKGHKQITKLIIKKLKSVLL